MGPFCPFNFSQRATWERKIRIKPFSEWSSEGVTCKPKAERVRSAVGGRACPRPIYTVPGSKMPAASVVLPVLSLRDAGLFDLVPLLLEPGVDRGRHGPQQLLEVPGEPRQLCTPTDSHWVLAAGGTSWADMMGVGVLSCKLRKSCKARKDRDSGRVETCTCGGEGLFQKYHGGLRTLKIIGGLPGKLTLTSSC